MNRPDVSQECAVLRAGAPRSAVLCPSIWQLVERPGARRRGVNRGESEGCFSNGGKGVLERSGVA